MKHLDSQNFNQELETKVKKIITEYNLIDKGDKVTVALSGGKDSVLTLHILDKLLNEDEFDFELIAIAIDEGIGGYREEGMESARNNAHQLEWNIMKYPWKVRWDSPWTRRLSFSRRHVFRVVFSDVTS